MESRLELGQRSIRHKYQMQREVEMATKTTTHFDFHFFELDFSLIPTIDTDCAFDRETLIIRRYRIFARYHLSAPY